MGQVNQPNNPTKSVLDLAKTRFVYLVAAIVTAAVVPELLSTDGFQWSVVWNLSKAPLAYWLITVFRDVRDPEIPNK